MRPERVVDVECFQNWFLIKFCDVATRTFAEFEVLPCGGFTPEARAQLVAILESSCNVTFNGLHYDMPMITAALAGHPPAVLKEMSNAIIDGNLQPWQFYQQFKLAEPAHLDHVDLFNVAPGQASLKIYGGRLHSRKLQDLPFEHDHTLTEADKVVGRAYCGNDLLTTIDMLNHLRPQLDLRVRVGQEYGLDLRSKSDAQMAEAIMKHAAGWVDRPVIPVGTLIRYTAPAWVQFQTQGLRNALAIAENSPFTVVERETKGELRISLQMHPDLENAQIVIARNVYQMGMGGLHSSERVCVQAADAGHVLSDFDVTRYYPSLIINLGIEPKQLAGVFHKTYVNIIESGKGAKVRVTELEALPALSAEQAEELVAQTALSKGFKTVGNGTFGKLFSKWSVMYDPASGVRITLTGQLALLMLIERLELAGIAVVSANTDGIVIRCPLLFVPIRDAIVRQWEADTSLRMESADYLALYSRDVNNYIAVKPGGKIKGKGAFFDEGIAKNPTNLICIDAVREFLTRGAPIASTVAACQDIRRFVTIRKVDGGATYRGQAIGKSIRWYYATSSEGAIHYATSGNTVPKTEGAMPLLELPDAMPADVDRLWYVREATSMLAQLGVATA